MLEKIFAIEINPFNLYKSKSFCSDPTVRTLAPPHFRRKFDRKYLQTCLISFNFTNGSVRVRARAPVCTGSSCRPHRNRNKQVTIPAGITTAMIDLFNAS